MKKILFLALLFPMIGFSQDIALIDRQLQKPAVFTNNITLNQLEQGLFLVYTKDVDDVINSIESLRSIVDQNKPITSEMQSFIKGNTYFAAAKNGDEYSIVIDTKSNKMGSYFILASKEKSKKMNLEHMDKFLAYLKANKPG